MNFVCEPCGYVYNPTENNNVAFADLADDYECPICGLGKDAFVAE